MATKQPTTYKNMPNTGERTKQTTHEGHQKLYLRIKPYRTEKEKKKRSKTQSNLKRYPNIHERIKNGTKQYP
eukprot:scaffold120173_cov35-Attheya_sp.AAC.1